ncbi:MAG: 2-amino-4-hydroxy-6-hydroxymethyldihydropteridine diphosphokinase [Kiritimatiellae bacterium]|nr:2-amino-4-hydroxy-6-hydroxymethyldihydropteridine diphosphokinase [Kiritimatiellia bacterium]
MHDVYLSLGTNLGDRAANLAEAKRLLADKLGTVPTFVSSGVIETEPVDVPEEFAALKFLNEMILVKTEKGPYEVSEIVHKIEDEMGRIRTVKNGPRVIDIDIIAYDDLVLDDPILTLPHPRAMERSFVLTPWKNLIRSEMKRKRAKLSPERRDRASHEICEILVSELDDAKKICAYEAFKTELDLSEFIEFCRAQGREVIFPEKCGNEYVVEGASEVDLWICPGLAFSERGDRVGFGGGWYDRFLAKAKSGSRKLGVAYSFQIIPFVPSGSHDIKLDKVISC